MATCETCHHPYDGEGCPNPACPANPSLSDEHRDAIYDRQAAHAADELERAERMRLYRSSFGPAPVVHDCGLQGPCGC